MIAPPILRQDRTMSEDWKAAYEANGPGLADALAHSPKLSYMEVGFCAGYLAQAERVERLREALEAIADESVFNQQRFAEDDDTDYFLRCFRAVKDRARQALADLQPKETR